MNGPQLGILFFAVLSSAVIVTAAVLDRRHSLLSPFWAILFPTFVGTTLKTIVHFSGFESSPVAAAYGAVDEHVLMMVAIMISAFFLLTAVTYSAVPSRIAPRPRSYLDGSAAPNSGMIAVMTAIILGGSAIALIMLLQEAGISFTSIASLSKKRRILMDTGGVGAGLHLKAFYALAELNVIILFAFWLRTARARQNVSLKICITASVLMVLVGSLLLSERTPVALIAIPILGFLLFERVISTPRFLLAVAAALMFANFVVLIRGTRDESVTFGTIASRFYELPVKLSEAENGTDVTKIGRIADYYSRVGNYMYGDSLRLASLVLIPRRLWPDKPEDLNLDYIVTKDIYGLIPEKESGVKPPSLIGECYMNGGWPAVLLGGAAYGFCLGLLMSFGFPREGTSIYKLTLFLLIFPLTTYLINMTYFTPVLVRLVLRIPPALLLIYAYDRLAFPRMSILLRRSELYDPDEISAERMSPDAGTTLRHDPTAPAGGSV